MTREPLPTQWLFAEQQATDDLILPAPQTEAEHALEVAERILDEVVPKLRMLTGEGWQLAYAQALGKRHTQDAARLRLARSLALVSGGRFGMAP